MENKTSINSELIKSEGLRRTGYVFNNKALGSLSLGCMPCPMGLDIPGILRFRNHYMVLKLESAKTMYQNRTKNDKFNASRCIGCKVCEGRCPNSLPISKMMSGVPELLSE